MILKKCNFRKFILISAVLSAHTYSLASCENIFSLAKTREQTVSSKSAFQAMNSNFCKEYSSARQKNQSMNAGGSYKLFSAQVGMSSESAEYIASVYCSAQDSSSAEQSAYQHYIENLSPFAYDAYSRCIAANEDIQYIVDSGKTDREFAVSINFRSGHTAVSRAEIEVSTSQGIRCSMDGAPLNRFVFEAGASRTVKCERSVPNVDGYVRFINRSSAARPVTFPWSAALVRPNDNVISDLNHRLKLAEQAIARVNFENGAFKIQATGTRPLTDNSACPTNERDAYRGITNGRINFGREFLETPKVIVALSHLDLTGDANRIAVGVTSVDRRGFNYRFVTWCSTLVYGAEASWIAFSR